MISYQLLITNDYHQSHLSNFTINYLMNVLILSEPLLAILLLISIEIIVC
jgi:hypothetical protein